MKNIDIIKENKELILEEVSKGTTYDIIGKNFNVTGSYIRKVIRYIFKEELPNRRTKNCNETFNKGKNKKQCLNCGKDIPSNRKYCCQKCFFEYGKKQELNKLNSWLNNEISGSTRHNITYKRFVKRYLTEKFNNRCEKCGWGETNTFTNNVPLELHHRDGNSGNNVIDNLELLCPNCHSLTENYKSRNKNSPKTKSIIYGKLKRMVGSDELPKDLELLVGNYFKNKEM